MTDCTYREGSSIPTQLGHDSWFQFNIQTNEYSSRCIVIEVHKCRMKLLEQVNISTLQLVQSCYLIKMIVISLQWVAIVLQKSVCKMTPTLQFDDCSKHPIHILIKNNLNKVHLEAKMESFLLSGFITKRHESCGARGKQYEILTWNLRKLILIRYIYLN